MGTIIKEVMDALGLSYYKLIGILLMLAVLIGLAVSYVHRGNTIVDLKVDNKELTKTNEGLKNDIALGDAVDSVNEDANVKLANNTETVVAKHEDSAKKMHAAIGAAVTEHKQSVEQSTGKVQINSGTTFNAEEEKKVAEAVINGLWDTYCTDFPDANSCKDKTTK